MSDDELSLQGARLVAAAERVKHPMLPESIKGVIVGAAVLVNELVKREVSRNEQAAK